MKTLLNTLFHSLAARLLVLFVIVSLCMTLLITGSLIHGFSTQWKHNIRPHLLNYLAYISDEIGTPPDIKVAQKLTDELPINIYIYGGDINFSSTGQPLKIDHLEFRRHQRPWRKPPAHHNDGDKPKHKKKYIPSKLHGKIFFGEYNDRTILLHHTGEYKVYYELSHKERRNQRISILQKSLFILLLIFIVSYFILRRILHPIKDIKAGVEKMRQDQLSYRIPIRKKNDLGELSQSINDMAEEIEQMLDSKRQLLLAVSHELRSPITRAKLAMQMMESSSLQESVERDLQEMEDLISEILEAERINSSHKPLHISELNVADLIQHIAQSFHKESLTTTIASHLPKVHWDETRIRLLLRNILSNAIHYSPNAKQVPHLSVSQQQNHIHIIIKDFGIGIPAEDLSKITEPFYRADPSRTRSTGGFGLGLYLCKLIVEAHHGKLKIDSTLGTGTTVNIQLPITSDL